MLIGVAEVLNQIVSWGLAIAIVWSGLRGRIGPVWIPVVVLLAAGALVALDGEGSGEILVARVAAVFVNSAMAALLAVFPTGRPVPRWAAVVAGVEIAIQGANLVSGLRLEGQPWWTWHFPVTTCLLVAAQVIRYRRRASTRERQQVRWVLAAVLGMVLAFLVVMVLTAGGVVSDELSAGLAILFLMLPGIGFSLAVLVPGAADVDRALVALLTVGGTALVTALAVLVTSHLAARQLWLAALVAAVVALPNWRGVGWLASRLVYGHRQDPLGTLDDLDALLAAHHDVREVPETIVATPAQALGAEHVAVRSVAGGTVGTGKPSGQAKEFPVAYRGERLAVVTVSPRRGEQTLTSADRAVIARVCAYAGPALDGARAVSELIEARARVVLAREEERKRLRRFLHDDLAPTFSGLALSVAALEQYDADGDGRAVEVAHRLAQELATATRHLREVAYALRPPALDNRGLLAALHDTVVIPSAIPASTTEVVIEASLPAPLPAARP